MNKQKVNVVVTDLDDTIWDWLTMWYNSFEPYLNRIIDEFDIDKNILKESFKKLHQKYHSSETSFAYYELDCLTDAQKEQLNVSTNKHKKSIIHEYNSLKKNNLFFCKGVEKTLKELKSKGVLLVGFTESDAFFTKYRLKHLNLDGIFDYIYAPIGEGVPESVDIFYDNEYWEPSITEFRYLAKGTVKPAPDILEIILRDCNADKQNTIYIGDKLNKDVYMANESNVKSVYAEYGDQIDSNKYSLLKEVTHWTDEDVKREKEYKEKNHTKTIADYTLKKSFKELDDYFYFVSFDKKLDHKNIPYVIDIWEKVVDVQQHFNEIELKIRNLALTLYTFFLGGIGYCAFKNLKINDKIPVASILALIAFLAILAFLYMDKCWYHKFLKGAGITAGQIEKKWRNVIPELKLSTQISYESHIGLFNKKTNSDRKYYFFYGLLLIPLLAICVILFFVDVTFPV